MEAQLIPVTDSSAFRPPPPGAAVPKPKPSAAPAPRLRPAAPAVAREPISTGAPISAADQIAGMLSAGEVAQFAEPAMDLGALSSVAAPMKVRARDHGPESFRRTIIPILLTFGIVLAGWAVLILTSGEDNALADLFPHWTPVALFSLAGIFLLLGVLNMLELKRDKKH